MSTARTPVALQTLSVRVALRYAAARGPMPLPSPDAPRARMSPAPTARVRLERRHPAMAAGGALLLAMLPVAALAPWLGTVDPLNINPSSASERGGLLLASARTSGARRLQPRVVWQSHLPGGGPRRGGARRRSLGLLIGVVTSASRTLDAVVVR